MAAFFLFAPTSAFLLSYIGKATIKPPARNLLLLRVFGNSPATPRGFNNPQSPTHSIPSAKSRTISVAGFLNACYKPNKWIVFVTS